MSEKKLKNAVRVDKAPFSENIVIERVFCSDGLTFVNLLICGDTRVSFTVDGTNPNIVFETIFGALHGFSLHSCLSEMVKLLHDAYYITHVTIDFDYEEN